MSDGAPGRDRHNNPRRFTFARATVAIVDVSIVVWGCMAAMIPQVLTAGSETYSDGSWSGFAARENHAAGFILVAFRLVGALNVAVGLALLAIALMAFRRAERWAWWTILFVNTVAIGAPIVYDRMVGFIGVFEILEYAALVAVYAALGATAFMIRTARPGATKRTEPNLSGRP